MCTLSDEEVRLVRDVVLQIGLDREALLSGIEPLFRSSIPAASTPGQQVFVDVHHMRQAGTLADGSVPLRVWLENAVVLSRPRSESTVFQRVLDRCKEIEHRRRRVTPRGAAIFGSAALVVAAVIGLGVQSLGSPSGSGPSPTHLTSATSLPLAVTSLTPGTPLSAGNTTMRWIPGSAFSMGSTKEELDVATALARDAGADLDARTLERETPLRAVVVEPFWLDEHEVTNTAFAAWMNRAPDISADKDGAVDGRGTRVIFTRHAVSGIRLEDRVWRALPGRDEHPVVLVSWRAAQRFCEERGARLPTEAEWDLAARGPKPRRLFVWGSGVPSCKGVVFGRGETPVCAGVPPGPAGVFDAAMDRTPEGIFGLGGNVREWVLDRYNGSGVVPGEGLFHVTRGCSWADDTVTCRAARRGYLGEDEEDPRVGFRCGMAYRAQVEERR